jgi:GDP-L-fucose synthase
MRILITGANGSLGRATVLEVQRRFPNAVCRGPERTVLDLLDSERTRDFVKEFNPTHVVHLAAKVFGIQGHRNFPLESLLTNTKIDLNLFSALASYPPKWIYYASTVATYGFPYESMPLQEQDFMKSDPHSSEYGYAQSKRHALTYLNMLKEHRGTEFVYGLMTNLYGQDDRYLDGNGHVLISLATKASIAREVGEPLSIWGDGTATRDFLSTQSASKIICDLFDQNAGILNIGSGMEVAISSLAVLVQEVFELTHGFTFTGENQGIPRRYLDIEKLRTFSRTAQTLDPMGEISTFFAQFEKSLGRSMNE